MSSGPLRFPFVVIRNAALALGLLFAAPSVSFAQAPPPDVVRTIDGAMYRGTIVELVPHDHVDLLLTSGATRRFPMASILSAGPANAAPATPTPTPVATPPAPSTSAGLRVRFTAPRPGFTLLVQRDSAALAAGGRQLVIGRFERLCTAPCETTVVRGSHRFAIETPRGNQRVMERPVFVTSDGELEVYRQSRRTKRIALAVAGAVVVGVGAGLAVHGVRCSDSFGLDCSTNVTYVWAGSVVVGVGFGFLIAAGTTRDRDRVRYVADR